MEKQEEILAKQIESIIETPFWIGFITTGLELLALVLSIAAIALLFTKTKAPGTLLMLLGLSLSIVFYVLPVFIFGSSEIVDANSGASLAKSYVFAMAFIDGRIIGWSTGSATRSPIK